MTCLLNWQHQVEYSTDLRQLRMSLGREKEAQDNLIAALRPQRKAGENDNHYNARLLYREADEEGRNRVNLILNDNTILQNFVSRYFLPTDAFDDIYVEAHSLEHNFNTSQFKLEVRRDLLMNLNQGGLQPQAAIYQPGPPAQPALIMNNFYQPPNEYYVWPQQPLFDELLEGTLTTNSTKPSTVSAPLNDHTLDSDPEIAVLFDSLNPVGQNKRKRENDDNSEVFDLLGTVLNDLGILSEDDLPELKSIKKDYSPTPLVPPQAPIYEDISQDYLDFNNLHAYEELMESRLETSTFDGSGEVSVIN